MNGGQLELFGGIEEWQSIKDFLDNKEKFRSAYSKNNTTQPDDDEKSPTPDEWGSDWRWEDEEEERTSCDEKSLQSNGNECWLQKCIIAYSPTADMFVIGREAKVVILTNEWDNGSKRMKYTQSFQGVLSQEEGETLTSIVCIPLISKKMSSPGVPDWTCVLVGFTTGHVRAYTQKGSLLVDQLFHDQQVQSFKVRSFKPSTNASIHDQLEEVIVFYQNVIVTLDGFGLFQTLRACRNHLARVQASLMSDSMVGIIDPPPLTYKKWELDNKDFATECEAVGLKTPSTFDHLFNASLLGGFYAKCKPVPPTSSVFVSTGKKPYVSFHFAQETQAIPVLTEIAYAMASKFKTSLLSAATGWLGLGGTGSTSTSNARLPGKEKSKIEPPAPMVSRFGFPDSGRYGVMLATSPCRKMSAVTDSLGRLIVFDNERGLAIRILKGYRDAQFSWLVVDENVGSKPTGNEYRKATFLVIYARRRGQLEVFTMQQGPKITSIGVSKCGQLLNTTYGMMGLNNIATRGGNPHIFQSIFMDDEGGLFTLNIPFHLAIDKANTKLKDMHLLKSLQKILRREEYLMEEIMELMVKIKRQSMINQAFRLLIQKCRQPALLNCILERYIQTFCEDEEKNLFVPFQLQNLLELYVQLIKSSHEPPSYEEASDEKSLLQCLHASGKELNILEETWLRISANKINTVKSVKFIDEEYFINLNDFFSCFLVEFDPAKAKAQTNNFLISLNLECDYLENFGKLLFCGVLNNTLIVCEWSNLVKNSGLVPAELLLLTLKFWCRNTRFCGSYVPLMVKLYQIVKILCEQEGYEQITGEFNQVSIWWDEIRTEIARCPKLFEIYSFAVICRAIAIDLQAETETESFRNKKDGKRDYDDSVELSHLGLNANEWENMSLDLLKWNVLLKQIEDLSILSEILLSKPKLDCPTLPILYQQIDSLSAVNLLDKGKGCIAELVGKWLTGIGIDPILIVALNNSTYTGKLDSDDLVKSEDPKDNISIADEGTCAVLELIKSLQENFSVSLTSCIVLANYCWEYCLEWNKAQNSVELFEAAFKCVSCIPTPHTKQGLMCMIWNTFLSKRLMLEMSINKAGHEKLPDKNARFASLEIRLKFFSACVSFLNTFMGVNLQCQNIQLPELSSSSKNHWSANDASASLADLANRQPLSSYEMVFLHYQLVLCAHLAYKFQIRKPGITPANLFDTQSRMIFFEDISNSTPYLNVEVDLALKNIREEFLCSVVSGAIRNITEQLHSSYDTIELNNIVPTIAVKECEGWIQKSFDLGRKWGLDLDGLRISQVCEYYSNGLDSLGLENIAAVRSKDTLGTKLLVIAGMRISSLISQNSDKVPEILASLSTNLSNWLDNLDYSILRSLQFSRESIVELAQQSIQLIPETSYDYKLAEEVLLSSSFL